MKGKTASDRVRAFMESLYYPVIAVVLALAIGAVLIALLGFDWVLAYRSLIAGSMGTVNAVAETLVKAVPLIFTGLSFAIGKKCGLVNLGAEGQVYMGGLFSAFVALSVKGLPLVIHLPLTVLCGALGGALLGLLTGWLKNRFGASELITGIMFNYIATLLVNYFVNGPLKEPGGTAPQSSTMPVTAQLPKLLPGTRLHAGLILALLCVVGYYVFLWKTPKGYELRLTGLNDTAAEYAGMNTRRNALQAMAIAGCLAGLAGSCEILGIQNRLFMDFSPNYGFDGIAVALLGNNNPVGILVSGLLFGVLRSGSNKMQMSAAVPVSLIQIIQALVILFVVGREMFNFVQKYRNRKAAKEGGQVA